MPTASVSTASAENQGRCSSALIAYLRSCRSESMTGSSYTPGVLYGPAQTLPRLRLAAGVTDCRCLLCVGVLAAAPGQDQQARRSRSAAARRPSGSTPRSIDRSGRRLCAALTCLDDFEVRGRRGRAAGHVLQVPREHPASHPTIGSLPIRSQQHAAAEAARDDVRVYAWSSGSSNRVASPTRRTRGAPAAVRRSLASSDSHASNTPPPKPRDDVRSSWCSGTNTTSSPTRMHYGRARRCRESC